jgi:D,D-heptose 1,7-bisphosphate phosphatase
LRQVVILAGGQGTRLKTISGELPKPLIPVKGKVLLQYLVEQCVKYGFFDIKLLVSYKKNKIEDFLGDGSKYGASIEYFPEETPRGTAGALLDSLPKLDEQFLVIYGDTFFDIDLGFFFKYHQSNGADTTIFLHPNDHPQDSDLVEIDSELKVIKIHPYPHDMHWRSNLVNAAIYIFNKDVLENYSFSSTKSDIAKDLFPLMLKRGKKLHGYLSTEYIKDIGTPDRLMKVERDITSGKVGLLKKQIKKTAIFLDRDGVINHDVNHLSKVEEFELINGAADAIRKINELGILAIIVTNQPVIARGELNESGLRIIHNKMDTLLGKKGAYIDRVYYCPHHPDSGFDGEIKALKFKCNCRKPESGMFLKARDELNIALERSWVVGDSTRDIMAAKKLNMKSILVKTGHAGKDDIYKVRPDFISEDLTGAAQIILMKNQK